MNVDAIRNVRRLDDVDVVLWLLKSRLHGWGFNQSGEALSIAIDGRINPIAYGNVGTGIRIICIDVSFGDFRSWASSHETARQKERGSEETPHGAGV
jgi:hypothetical protein